MDVRLDGVRCERDGRCVLDIPAVAFSEGRITAILGPNGAGKTTLLRVVAGIERPAAGAAWIGPHPVRSGAETRRLVAYAFQRPLFLRGSLRQNLELPLKLRGVDRDARGVRVAEAAGACGVAHLLDRPAHAISGGEGQRANLARALATGAPLTLLDEPLAGVDAPSREQLIAGLPALLRRFTATAIVVTHDRDEARRLAGDIVVLIDGRVTAAGAKAAVLGAPPNAATAAFLGWAVLVAGERLVAVEPGALRLGDGDVSFALRVEGVVDLGTGFEVAGSVGTQRVAVPAVSGQLPSVGATVLVSAPVRAVRSLDRLAPG